MIFRCIAALLILPLRASPLLPACTSGAEAKGGRIDFYGQPLKLFPGTEGAAQFFSRPENS